jgi:hypothetical protein
MESKQLSLSISNKCCCCMMFGIFMQGLEEQLLAELVRAERPELEESRDSLITSISADKRQSARQPLNIAAP